MNRLLMLGAVTLPLMSAGPVRAQPIAEKELLAGQLASAEKLLTAKLAEKANDDAVRFELGMVQLLRAVEKTGSSLFRHGLRFGEVVPLLGVRLRLGDKEIVNPKPEKLSYAQLRQILQTWVDDLARVETTLAGIQGDFKLPIPLGRVSVDVFGIGKPISAAELLRGTQQGEAADLAEKFIIAFDRGDAYWLRGYCHLLSAFAETLLAVDGQELFECSGHLLFANIETPHTFLKEDMLRYDRPIWRWNPPEIMDTITLIHLSLKMPVKEPKRFEAVRKHLLGMTTTGKLMWKSILAETDDDREWIPNPKQTGVLGIPVQQSMIDGWVGVLEHLEQLLEGKTLLPFWRGKEMHAYWKGMAEGQNVELPWLTQTTTVRGINLKAVLSNPPRDVDLIRWIQGTAATPYLEKGKLSPLASLREMNRLDQAFGGFNFFGFALWFN